MIIIQACNLQPTQLPSSHRPINLQLTVKCNVPEAWVGSLKTLTYLRLLFLQKKDVRNITKICIRFFLPSQSSLLIHPTEIDHLRASNPPMRRFHGQRSVKRTIFLPSSIRHQGFLQGWAKKWSPGLVTFVPAVAYHFCLNLPENLNLKNSRNPGLFSPSQYLLQFQPM